MADTPPIPLLNSSLAETPTLARKPTKINPATYLGGVGISA